MSSLSNRSFLSRLGNAQKIKIIVSNFKGYKPPVENASVKSLEESIIAMTNLQTKYDQAIAMYLIKTKLRKGIFLENEDGIDKRMSLIILFVVTLKGKESFEAIQIGNLINKIRCQVTFNPMLEDELARISQIERNYASSVSDFKQIIAILFSFEEDHSPPNTLLSFGALKKLVEQVEKSTVEVDKALNILKPIIEERREDFAILKAQVQTIKNFIKAQYGRKSSEYKQIKGLSV